MEVKKEVKKVEQTLNPPITLALNDFFRDASDMIIPKKIYLFEFPENKDMRICYVKNDYDVKELVLDGCHSSIDMSFIWKNYVNRVCNPDKYSYRYYKDDLGNMYLILIEAIGRNKKFKDGSLPFACKLAGYNCYADVFPNLKLPNCF